MKQKTHHDDEGVLSPLIGHNGAKLIIRSALRDGGVDLLLSGPPASGKSVALLAIEENVPGAEYKDASGYTQAKLRDAFAENPEILALDELDAMENEAYKAMNLPMEQGLVTKDTMHESYTKEVDTQVIAASNSVNRIPHDIVSRFRVVEFDEYSHEEYLDVCEHLLVDVIDWLDIPEDARYIADEVYDAIGSKDPRDPRDVARLAGANTDPLSRVRDIAIALDDPTADVESVPLSAEEIARARGIEDETDDDSGTSLSFREWKEKACPHLSNNASKETSTDYKSGILNCPACRREHDVGPREPIQN